MLQSILYVVNRSRVGKRKFSPRLLTADITRHRWFSIASTNVPQFLASNFSRANKMRNENIGRWKRSTIFGAVAEF